MYTLSSFGHSSWRNFCILRRWIDHSACRSICPRKQHILYAADSVQNSGCPCRQPSLVWTGGPGWLGVCGVCGAADAACCCSLAGWAAGLGPLGGPPATSSCGSRQTLTTIAISRARKVLSSELVARISEQGKWKSWTNGSANSNRSTQSHREKSRSRKWSIHSKYRSR